MPPDSGYEMTFFKKTQKNGNKKWHTKMIGHNHFICHLILGTFTEYPSLNLRFKNIYYEFNTKIATKI